MADSHMRSGNRRREDATASLRVPWTATLRSCYPGVCWGQYPGQPGYEAV